MGKMQRTKGATYEREVARAFTDAIAIPGVEIKRNIGQARDGGNDLDVGPLLVECKRRKSLKMLEDWFEQVETAVRDRGGDKMGAIVARQDSGESFVLMRLDDFLDLTADEIRVRAGYQFLGSFEMDADGDGIEDDCTDDDDCPEELDFDARDYTDILELDD